MSSDLLFEFFFRSISVHLVISAFTLVCSDDMLNENIEPVDVQHLHDHQEDEVGNAYTKSIWHRTHRFIRVYCEPPYIVYQMR